MKASTLILLFIVGALTTGAAQNRAEPVAWTDSARDVIINGELDRAAQVLTSEETQRIAIISPKLESAVMLDLSRRTINTSSKDSFRFYPDRVIALTEAGLVFNPAGSYTLIGESDYNLILDGNWIQIKTHQGLVGETDQQRLFETVPVWRFAMESYQADPKAVADLKSCQPETLITVALATWCPDSKRHVPRLLKAVQSAGNDHLRIKLIGIGRKFREPAEMIKQSHIAHVPTIIVERNGVELGRIVENPTAKTIEEDLAALVIRTTKLATPMR